MKKKNHFRLISVVLCLTLIFVSLTGFSTGESKSSELDKNIVGENALVTALEKDPVSAVFQDVSGFFSRL